jgi:hypothetical protein
LPSRFLFLLGFNVLLKRVARRQREELHPGIVLGGQRASELAQLAWSLPVDAREDRDAVRALRERAGRHREDLRWAAASTRQTAWITEDGTAYRAHQLLLAAAENRQAQPVTGEQAAWFEQLDAFSAGGDASAFARLVALQPRLTDIERQVTRIVDELHRCRDAVASDHAAARALS